MPDKQKENKFLAMLERRGIVTRVDPADKPTKSGPEANETRPKDDLSSMFGHPNVKKQETITAPRQPVPGMMTPTLPTDTKSSETGSEPVSQVQTSAAGITANINNSDIKGPVSAVTEQFNADQSKSVRISGDISKEIPAGILSQEASAEKPSPEIQTIQDTSPQRTTERPQGEMQPIQEAQPQHTIVRQQPEVAPIQEVQPQQPTERQQAEVQSVQEAPSRYADKVQPTQETPHQPASEIYLGEVQSAREVPPQPNAGIYWNRMQPVPEVPFQPPTERYLDRSLPFQETSSQRTTERYVYEAPPVQEAPPQRTTDRYLNIDEIYASMSLQTKRTDTVYLVEEYMKTLPVSLPEESRREIVGKIVAASGFDYDMLMGDGVLRVKMIKDYAEKFARYTEEYVSTRNAELAELEKQAKKVKGLIENRRELHRKQFFTIEEEAQRLKDILIFISS